MALPAIAEPNTPSSVLLVGQDSEFLETVAFLLGSRGITAQACRDFVEGTECFDTHRAIVAQVSPSSNGDVTSFLETVRSRRSPGFPRPLVYGIATGSEPPSIPLDSFDAVLPPDTLPEEVVDRVSRHLGTVLPSPRQLRTRGGILDRILAPPKKVGVNPEAGFSPQAPEPRSIAVPPLATLPGEVPMAGTSTPNEKCTAFRPAPSEDGPLPPPAPSPFSLVPPEPLSGAAAEEDSGESENTPESGLPRIAEPGGERVSPDALLAPPKSPAVPSDDPGHAKTLVECAPVALAMFDGEMRYVATNHLWIEAFHLQDTPLIGRSQYEVFPGLHPTWRKIYERCLQGKAERSNGDRFRRADGSVDWVRWEVRPWMKDGHSLENDGVSAVGGLVISCEVLPSPLRNDEKLDFERGLANALFSTHTAPVMVVGVDGVVLRANPAARKLAPCEQLVENAAPYWNQLLNGDQRDSAVELFTRLRQPAAPGELPADVPPLLRETLHLASGETNITWLNIPQRAADGTLQAIVRVGTLTAPPDQEAIPEIPVDQPFSARVIEPGTRDGSGDGDADFIDVELDEDPAQGMAAPSIQHLATAVFTCDENLVPTGGNEAWLKTADVSDSPTILDSFLEADWPELEAALRACFETGETVVHHCRLATCLAGFVERETHDSQPVLVEATPTPTGIVATVIDDSERAALQASAEESERELAAARVEIRLLEERLAAAEAKAAGDAKSEPPAGEAGDAPATNVIAHPVTASLHPATVAAHAPVAFLLLDRDGDLVFANPQHTHLLGTQATEFASMEDWLADRCTDAEHAATVRETWRDKIWRKQATRILPLLNADGILKDIRFLPRLLRDGSLLLTLADVTETHRGEQALRASEARLRALFRDCGVPVATVDATGDISTSTRALETLLGFSAREMRQLSIGEILFDEADLATRDALLESVQSAGVPTAPARIALKTKTGARVPADLQLSKIQEEDGANLIAYVFAVASGDNPRPPTAARNAAADADHRTRNNLQIISTLLNLQRARTQDPAVRNAIGASQGRLRALALVHQHTSGGETGFAKFADALSKQILGGEKRLAVHVDLAPSLSFPLPKAVSLGLCLNELLANTATHAFPDGISGSARIGGESRLGTDGDPEFTLIVADDGVGLPENFDPRIHRGLGLQIIQSLADQLDAAFESSSNQETTEFRLTIPL